MGATHYVPECYEAAPSKILTNLKQREVEASDLAVLAKDLLEVRTHDVLGEALHYDDGERPVVGRTVWRGHGDVPIPPAWARR